MAITLACPSCGKHYVLADDQAGKSMTCWQCGQAVAVGQGQPAEVTQPIETADSVSLPEPCDAATASFVLGLLALVTGPITGIVAALLGVVAIRRIEAAEGRLKGLGFAIAGICTSVVGTMWVTAFGGIYLMTRMNKSL
jgi:hypothetical protein